MIDEYEQGLKKEQERLQRQILENQELLEGEPEGGPAKVDAASEVN